LGCYYVCECPSSPVVFANSVPANSYHCFWQPCPLVTYLIRVPGAVSPGQFFGGHPTPWCRP
jgi:hypothetical protein